MNYLKLKDGISISVKNRNLFLLLFLFFNTIDNAKAWDSAQLEVFDVVEEVKINFYELLNITNEAAPSEIRSSFRRLSLKLHPDKNPDRDTSVEFRNLVSVYDILKDSNKRKYYDEVLINGLPNWRSAVFYYRHVRKMGLIEASIILFAIITIGQYLVAWGSYLEMQYTLSQKKRTRKERNVIIDIPKPSFANTLPIQIPKLIFYIIVSLPKVAQYFKQKAIEKVETMAQEALAKAEEEEEEELVESKPRRRKPGFVVPEGPTFEVQEINNKTDDKSKTTLVPPPVSGGFWTDDDLDELVQLVKKYPGGIPGRWELIAEALGRSVAEVTYMANKMKNSTQKISAQEEVVEQPKQKQKTKGGKLGLGGDGQSAGNWTQVQQKALEEALLKYPKGATDRWDRIAECVPNKTKEECILRFKHLAEMIKKQRSSEQEQGDAERKENDDKHKQQELQQPENNE